MRLANRLKSKDDKNFRAEYFLYMPNATFLSNVPIANDNGAFAQEVCSQVGGRKVSYNELDSQMSIPYPSSYEWKYFGYLHDDRTGAAGKYVIVRPFEGALQAVGGTQAVGFICFGFKPAQGFLGIPSINRCYWNANSVSVGPTSILTETFSVKANDNTPAAAICTNLFGAAIATESQIASDFYAGAAICATNIFKSDDGVLKTGYYYNMNNIPQSCAFGFTKESYPGGKFNVLCSGCKPTDNPTSATNTLVQFNTFTGQYSRYENMPLYTPQISSY
ncbi:hypothetical protein DFA_08144 [Cavenderia fasciculata]|uniref:Uncharacterized protein n=1 Tax=Cavenderia fasciculata TaxID=261658 RepID=F4Q5A1_CACFS|nr:uncharacterized protein DFA_08144 [Cavenderia fasciculata]EGG17160.1 hypothetical protein DFA_08144 [Cavenderia fasciculata]|eukprot:XP_004355644.1 hypothetical protein DFA_08144 [Cavenderia fasciculata]